MVFRIVVIGLLLSFSACRVNEMGCPRQRAVKLNRKPSNYMRTYYKALEASRKPEERVSIPRPKPKPVKNAANIEEWDCPRPGAATPVPRAVKANIRKNKRRFEEFYRNRTAPPDSLLTLTTSGR